MKNWKTINSKVAYECKYLKVVENDFIVPGGKKYRYYMIDRTDYVIIIARDKNYYYLIDQYRYTVKSKLLQVVAGAIEKEETPLIAARKELKEETGITAKKLKKLGWFYSYYGCMKQKAYVYLAEGLEFGDQKLEGLEKESEIKVEKIKQAEIRKLIQSGKIKDADTICAFSILNAKIC